MTKKFTCARCRETFDQGWTDEEAAAERECNFPGWTEDECDVLCDDCYDRFMEWAQKRQLVGKPKEGE